MAIDGLNGRLTTWLAGILSAFVVALNGWAAARLINYGERLQAIEERHNMENGAIQQITINTSRLDRIEVRVERLQQDMAALRGGLGG